MEERLVERGLFLLFSLRSPKMSSFDFFLKMLPRENRLPLGDFLIDIDITGDRKTRKKRKEWSEAVFCCFFPGLKKKKEQKIVLYTSARPRVGLLEPGDPL